MSTIKKFKAPEINLNKINSSIYNTSNSINSYTNSNLNSINQKNTNENSDITNIEFDIPTAKGHSSSSYSDQEDILINGICSKLTNDINNKFNDAGIKDVALLKLNPIFTKIIEGKKINDIVDENGRIKDIDSIITEDEKKQLAEELRINSTKFEKILENINHLLTDENNEKLKIVDYPDKMSSDIMECKINKIVFENSGFNAVVLEEKNGNLMPIISGTNTSQTTDLLADLYPIIKIDANMTEIINTIDEILSFNFYEDNYQNLIDLKRENEKSYWALINIVAEVFTENPALLKGVANWVDFNKLNWIDDFKDGDRDGVIYWIVKTLAHIPDLYDKHDPNLLLYNLYNPGKSIRSKGIVSLILQIIISKLGITRDNPTLLGKFCELVGLNSTDMLAIKKVGFLNYMKSCYETQRDQAKDLIYETIQEAKDKDVKVDINGYSLGGGLALTSYANICLDDPNMEQYINSVTAYDPAIIHTEREETDNESNATTNEEPKFNRLIEYISNSDKTKLFIVSGDLTATHNKTLKTGKLDKQTYFINPKKEVSDLTIGVSEKNERDGEVYIENSFKDNEVLKDGLSKLIKKLGLNFSDEGLISVINKLDIIREEKLYKENDSDSDSDSASNWNRSLNFILNKVILDIDSVEDAFFGETHYMSSIDYERDTDESGNFINQAPKRIFEEAHGASDSEQSANDGNSEILSIFSIEDSENNN